MANKLQFLPLLCFVLFPITFITTYTIALSHEHIHPIYAYISDTGTLPPESCWFGLLLSLTGMALGSTVYVRYKQIQSYFRKKDVVWTKRMNSVAMVIGQISALGVVVVGAFQPINLMSMHLVGAIMSFLGGSIYLTMQAIFTFQMLPTFTNVWVASGRLFIGIACTVLFIVTIVCGVLSFQGFEGSNPMKWDENEPMWALRVVSVASEWTMAALLDIYILSFVLDFRKLSVKGPSVRCP